MHPPILTLIYQQGCPACEAAKPEFAKLMEKQPRLMFRFADIDKTRTDFPVPYTPAFLFQMPGGGRYYADAEKFRGNVTWRKLENWLKQCAADYDAKMRQQPQHSGLLASRTLR